MAEMTTLVAAIYRRYETRLKPEFEKVSPGITSRFEVFRDDTISDVKVSVQVSTADHIANLSNRSMNAGSTSLSVREPNRYSVICSSWNSYPACVYMARHSLPLMFSDKHPRNYPRLGSSPT